MEKWELFVHRHENPCARESNLNIDDFGMVYRFVWSLIFGFGI